MIQRMTKAHQYQVVKRRLRKGRLMREWVALVCGRRLTARCRSESVRYGAVVVVGVSGKRNRP